MSNDFCDSPAMTEPMTTLQQKLNAGRFVITAEITPPVSFDRADLMAKAAPLKGLADAVNVTDGAGARPHMGALSAAAILVEAGIEPILQLTCRDRNRIALQSEYLRQIGIMAAQQLRDVPQRKAK